jgi:hypothetical protein
MADYFETGANAAGTETGAAAGGAATTANGDAAMDDEIMVSHTAELMTNLADLVSSELLIKLDLECILLGGLMDHQA